MDRRKFIHTAGVVAGTTILAQQLLGKELLSRLDPQAKRPNVLFIMTDQQSYNMMSCMGNTWLSTPNMDYIAKMGYRFEKTYCANPGETINYANDSSYSEIKATLKKELMANLSQRGLTPLPENRTIQNIRKAEKAKSTRKKDRPKNKIDYEE